MTSSIPEENNPVSTFGSLTRNPENALIDDEEEEEGAEDGVLFLVNKGGFPLDDYTYERMWNRASKIHPGGMNIINKIRGNTQLPEVPMLVAPVALPAHISVIQRLEIIQKYMNDLQYNHTGTQFFEIRKNRPLSGLMDTAKEMIKDALPIKCLEAVILAIYLTNGFVGLDRIPLSFRSRFNGVTHCHVVLAVYYNGLYGALGMSRRQDLMNKAVKFKSLSSMVLDYKKAYSNYMHELRRVAVGTTVPHDPHSYEHIEWRGLVLPTVHKMQQDEMCKGLDRYAREARAQIKTLVTAENSHQLMKRTTPGLKPLDGQRGKQHQKARKKSAKKRTGKISKPEERNEAESSSDNEGSSQSMDQAYQIRI